MARILCIETATEVCSVALAENGKTIAVKDSDSPNVHSTLLTVHMESIMLDANMEMNSLSAIAVSIGPGSYTGLRIGLSAAKGLCYSLDIPLLTIPTLQIMAFGAMELVKEIPSPLLLAPMIDARRMEVYSAFFHSDGSWYREAQADIIDRESYNDFLGAWKVVFFGNGMQKCRNVLRHEHAYFLDAFRQSAAHMSTLSEAAFNAGDFADLAYSEPFYLKEFQTKPPKKML